MNFNCKNINEFELSEYQTLRPIKWMKLWSNQTIWNGKNIKELLVYENISIFWYLESRLFFKRIQALIILIEQLKTVFAVEKPEKVWVIGNRDLVQIVSQLHDNLEKCIEIDNIKKSNTSDKSYSGFLTWKLILLKIIRGVFTTKNSDKMMKKPILIILELGGWRKIYDHSSKNYEYREIFFQNIIKKLKKEGQNVEIIDFENKPGRILNSFFVNRKRIQSFNSNVEPWEKFLSLEIILKSRKAYVEIKKKWSSLKKSNEFKKSLEVDGISIYNLVKDDFEELFNSFKALAAIAMIETTKKIVNIKNPSIIVMHDEYGALQLSFLYASKRNKIPTLSVQHGAIHDDIFAYTHFEDDVNNIKKELNFVLPDKMCVWSENSKKTLINAGKFPSTTPIVTGDPKRDYLKSKINEFQRDKTLKDLNIALGRKIILFATENLTNLEEKLLISNTIFESILELDSFFLIIKMHPNETDELFYHNIAKKLGVTTYLILRDIDLYEIINASDVVIVSFSTVGLESMYMSKPVISLNLMGLHNESIMIKNNLVTEIKEKNELVSDIIECIKNKNNQKLQKAKEFAEFELGKIDGCATDRIVEKILQFKNSDK